MNDLWSRKSRKYKLIENDMFVIHFVYIMIHNGNKDLSYSIFIQIVPTTPTNVAKNHPIA
jgi:hypothetical protein